MPETTVYTNNKYYQDIADAIREKNGTENTYTPAQMAPAIRKLAGGETPGETINNQNKTVTPTESQQLVTADNGYTGLGTVTVNPISSTYVGTGVTRQGATTITPSDSPQIAVAADTYVTAPVEIEEVPTEEITATANGIVTPSSGKFLSRVTVNVPVGATINNQDKNVAPTEEEQTIVADNGYTGLGVVTVRAIDENYVGSGVARNNSNSLSAVGGTVTVPAGYYSIQATKTITASELVSGTLNIDDDGTYDVTNYASAEVAIDYVSKTLPLTIINHLSSNITLTSSVLTANIIGTLKNKQYIRTMNAGIVNANSQNTYRVPGAGFLLYLIGASRDTNFEVHINDTVKTPLLEGKNSTGRPIKVYHISSSNCPAPDGGVIDIYESTDSFKESVILDTLIATTNDTYTAPTGTAYSSVTVNIPSDINNQNKTATPTGDTQTITPDTGYSGLGTVTVYPIPSQYIVPTGTLEIVANGTKDVTSYASVDVNIPSDINNQEKTVTPTKASQEITPDTGYSGLGKVTVNPIPASYITTSDADAVAANILLNKTAYVNGSKITGIMANNGATGGTITTQGGTYTIPAGYTSGGTVTASLTGTTLTDSIISGTAYEETSGDYAWRSTVQIPEGYHNAATITKEFSSIFPAPESEGDAAKMLLGYQLYDHDGKVITGTMPNSTFSATLDDVTASVPIPAGYHTGTGTISHNTVAIPSPEMSFNSTTGVITASGSWTKGYTTNNSYSNTYSLTTRSVSDLTVSGATVTAPAGYYAAAASKSVAAMTLPTAISNTSSGTRKLTVGRSTNTQYINIPVGYNSTAAYYQISAVANGSATNSGSASGTSASLSTGTNTLTLSKAVSITPTVTAGYISSGTAGNVTVTLTANVTTKAAATITPGTSNQTIAAGTYLTGTQTIAGDADLVAGNIKSGVNIFGVSGTFTSDADATANDIISGATAYVDGELITGELVVNKYYTGTTAPAAALGNNGDIYLQQ